jgi:hypothetical protein
MTTTRMSMYHAAARRYFLTGSLSSAATLFRFKEDARQCALNMGQILITVGFNQEEPQVA